MMLKDAQQRLAVAKVEYELETLHAEHVLNVARLQRQTRAADRIATRFDRFKVGVQGLRIAVGGRTFIATLIALVMIPAMTIVYLYLPDQAYIPLLIGCALEALVLLFWIYRNQQIKSLSGAGAAIEFDDTDVPILNNEGCIVHLNKQIPGRRRRITSYDDEDLELHEASESLYKTEG